VAVKPIAIHEIVECAGTVYEAVIVSSKRARQIHDDMKIELAQRLETIKALTTTPETEDDLETTVANPDQLKISMEFEKRPKATELALNELMQRKINYRFKEPVAEFMAKETPAAEE
jgi:DNA-directed RNA polymerase subunit K/omega